MQGSYRVIQVEINHSIGFTRPCSKRGAIVQGGHAGPILNVSICIPVHFQAIRRSQETSAVLHKSGIFFGLWNSQPVGAYFEIAP